MLDNLCNIGRLLRKSPATEESFNPFIREVVWAKDKKPPFEPLPRHVLNIPLVNSPNGLALDLEKAEFGENENAEYRTWKVLYNPNAGASAMWLDGDFSDISLLTDATKLVKSNPLAQKYFPNGLYNIIPQHISEIEKLLEGKDNYLVHFLYPNNKEWFEQKDFVTGFNSFLREELIKQKKVGKSVYLIPVYNYLSCTIEDNQQAPGFDSDNLYKNISFTGENATEQVIDFFWAQDFYTKSLMKLKGDYELRVLPDATDITSKQLVDFYSDIDAANRLKLKDKLQRLKIAENHFKVLKPGSLSRLAKINIDPSRNMQHMNFAVVVYVATSTFTKKEVMRIQNLNSSYLTKRLVSWQNLIKELKQTSEWTEAKVPVDYVVWGENVWSKEEKRFVEYGAIQSLFIHDKYTSLYPTFFYQIVMGNFSYDNLNRVFLETLHDQALKGGLSPKNESAAFGIARQLKNSLLILNGLQMKNSNQSLTSFTKTPSFKLGVALGTLLNYTKNEKRFPNLYNRVYEVAGAIKRHVGNINDVIALVSDIDSRMLRNHSKGDRHDTAYFRKVNSAVFDAIEAIDKYVTDEVATGFYWQFLKPYEAKDVDSESEEINLLGTVATDAEQATVNKLQASL